MKTYTVEITKTNLENAYGEKWFILSKKSIVCPALELIFSLNEDGSLHPVDAEKINRKQDENEGVVCVSSI